jgi:hypothetical protein
MLHSVEPKGTPKHGWKYRTVEEAKEAQYRQIKEYHERKKESMVAKRCLMSPLQLKLLTFLSDNIINNTPLLQLIYERLQKHRLGLKKESLILSRAEDNYEDDDDGDSSLT